MKKITRRSVRVVSATLILVTALCFVFPSCSQSGKESDPPVQKCLTAMLECPDDELFPPGPYEPFDPDGTFNVEANEARKAAMEAADAVWRERLGGYFLEGDLDRFMARSYRLDFHSWAWACSGTISIKEIQEEEIKERIQWFNVTLVMTNEDGGSRECVTRWRAIYLDDSLNMLSQLDLMDDGGYYQILRDL